MTKAKLKYAFYILFYAFALWMFFVWEPDAKDRIRVCDFCVYQALEGRPKLPEFLNYADDIDFWFTTHESYSGSETAACSFGMLDGALLNIARTPDIYVHIESDTPEEWQDLLNWCVFHEIGHYIDAKLDVSKSEGFRQAVELSILIWQNLSPDKTYVWQWVGEKIATFPGINGNPLAYEVWGGWGELYADLHDINYLSEIPPPLRKYFADFIPWSP